jgi:hypothetical protein
MHGAVWARAWAWAWVMVMKMKLAGTAPIVSSSSGSLPCQRAEEENPCIMQG